MRHKQAIGFTTYELLITLLIIGVVIALGLPNLGAFSTDQRLTLTTTELQNAFKLARSEAIRLRGNVTICASENSTASDADCRGRWQDGFIVFVDTDGNLQRAGADEKLLRTHAAADDVHMIAANDAHYYSFGSAGTSRGDLGGAIALSEIVICDARAMAGNAADDSSAHLFIATPHGLAMTSHDVDMIDSALRRYGKACS